MGYTIVELAAVLAELDKPATQFASTPGIKQETYTADEASSNESKVDETLGALSAEPTSTQRLTKLLELKGEYLHEKRDSKHRMGAMLAAALKIYTSSRLGQIPDKYGANNTDDFIMWLDGIPEFERVMLLSTNLKSVARGPAGVRPTHDENLTPSVVRAFLTGVKYLDRATRKDYKIKIENGMLYQGGKPFSTEAMHTVFSGNGWAIWVMGGHGGLYAGNHEKGSFHHSTFKAGGAVVCGGELVARGGRLLLLSAKSGHYMPPLDNFVEAIRRLGDQTVDLNSLNVMVWKKGDSHTPIAIPASDFVANPGGFDVWGSGTLDEHYIRETSVNSAYMPS